MALAFLGMLGWVLFHVLPLEPRWRVPLEDKNFATCSLFWEADGKRIRVVGQGRDKERIVNEETRKNFLASRAAPGPRIFDAASGSVVARFPDHQGRAPQFAHSSNGRYGAGLLESGKVRLTDFGRHEEWLIETEGSFPRSTEIRFTNTGDHLLITDEEHFFVFAVSTRERIFECELFGYFYYPSFLPDDRTLIYFGKDVFLHLHDLTTNREVAKLPTGPHFFASSDNRYLATRSNCIVDSNSVPFTALWDISKRDAPVKLLEFQGNWRPGPFSPDGTYWLTSNPEGNVQIWDIRARRVLSEFGHRSIPIPDHYSYIEYFFSPDSRKVAAVDVRGMPERLRLFDLGTGQKIWEGLAQISGNNIATFDAPKFTGDSSKLIIRSIMPWSYQILDVKEGVSVAQFATFSRAGASQLTSDSRFLLIPTDDRSEPSLTDKWLEKVLPKSKDRRRPEPLSVVDMQTHEVIVHLDDAPAARTSLAPDGKSLVILDIDDKENCVLICWDVPGVRAWRWIVGVPATLGCALFLLGRLRQRRRQLSRAASVGA